MTKTLDQLAEEYVKSTLVGSPSVKKNAYKAGANAVLDEIERVAVIDKGDDIPWLLRGNHLYNVLMDKIKQLKGE